MKKIVFKILLFCLIPLPFLYALHYMVDEGLQKSENGIYSEWNDLYGSKINADLIALGSSRSWVHISPQIMDSTLHLNSYVLSMDGYPFSMQYALFRIYVQHNRKPKYLLHCIDLTTFSQRADLWDYEQFLPYLHDTIIRHETSRYIGRFNALQYYFPLYKYNNHGDLIKEGLLSYFNKSTAVRDKYKGYKGSPSHWDGSFSAWTKQNPKGVNLEINDTVKYQYHEFLSYCKNNDIKVILVLAPIHHELIKYHNNANEVLSLFRQYASQYNITMLNYLDHSLCYDTAYFYNSQHLNKKGSEIFSHQLAADLGNILGR